MPPTKNDKNLCVFVSFPLATKMFQFASLPSNTLCIQVWMSGNNPRRVAPLGHFRVKGCLGPNRNFSHLATSFFGFLCRGIHRLHLSVRNRLNV